MDEPEKKKRTEKATATRMRQREERYADLLVARGWIVRSPEGERWDLVRGVAHQVSAIQLDQH
jgi:hypothetical protein